MEERFREKWNSSGNRKERMEKWIKKELGVAVKLKQFTK